MLLRVRPRLPAYLLYGDAPIAWAAALHLETIQARSARHGWRIDPHVHPQRHQVLWALQGPVEAMLDGRHVKCEGPVAVLIPAGVVHAFELSPHTVGQVLTFDPAALAEGERDATVGTWLPLFAQAGVHGLPAAEAARLQRLFDALSDEAREGGPEPRLEAPLARWLARCIVFQLARALGMDRLDGEGPAAPGSAQYDRWTALVEANYRTHQPVAWYAAQLGLSPERLGRLVQARSGLTPQALLHQRLLREAERRLLHLDTQVARVAFDLGFRDPAYFGRFFRRHTGHTPLAWRQAQRARIQG